MEDFNIIEYLSTLTGYAFEENILRRIAYERGASGVTSIDELTDKQRDLMLADMLMVIYLTPSTTPSISKKHGSFSYSTGSQVITDKDSIYEMLTSIYRKYDDPKLETAENMGGYIDWVED